MSEWQQADMDERAAMVKARLVEATKLINEGNELLIELIRTEGRLYEAFGFIMAIGAEAQFAEWLKGCLPTPPAPGRE